MLLKILKDDVLAYFKKRITFFSIILSFFMMLIVVRLLFLQIVYYDHYKNLSENNRIRLVGLKADRGFIKDRNGAMLVRNRPSYELKIVKEDVKNMEELLKRLSQVVEFDKAYARKKIGQSYMFEPAVIARGLKFEQVAYLLENNSDYLGVEVGLEPVRSYIDGESLSHVIGYLAEVTEGDMDTDEHYDTGDMIGKTGLEKIHERILRGKDGARHVEVDSYGRVLEILSEKEAIPGNNLILTIDYRLQKFIHDIFDGKVASAVVMDINDFSILALYSSPSYDLNIFTPFASSEDRVEVMKNPDKPLLNRVIEGRYPPGSVYKILMAVAGLMEKKITVDTKFTCTGEMQYGNFKYRCWNRHGHGSVNLTQAIEQSCDVYFYNLGLILGIENITKYSNFFSLGVKTGIRLPNEKSGLFPSKEWKRKSKNEPWYPGETIITSIGQGYMSTTPLQIAVMLSGIFNGGSVYVPKLVGSVEDMETGEQRNIKSVLVNKMDIPKNIRDIVLKGMEDVVHGKKGTGYRARVPGILIGGKTGTAQVVSLKKTEHMDEDEIPEHMRDHSWFSAVYPSVNPRYVAVVMVEHGGSGSKSAATVAGAIVNKMMDLGYVKAE